MAITLTLDQKRVSTFTPGSPSKHDWDDADIATSENRIGERKQLQFDFTSSANLAGKNIYINPGLFLPVGYVLPAIGAGVVNWSTNIPANSGSYYCSYNGGGNIFPLRDINYSVLVEVLTATTFRVFVDFIQTADLGSYLNPNVCDNHDRLFKDRFSNINELTVSGSSVYNDVNVDGRCYFYIEEAADLTNNGFLEVLLGGYKAGFYGKNAHEATPYFSVPVWTVKYLSVASTAIKSLGFNDVEFFINSPTAPTGLYMWIVRADTNDPYVDFLTSYEYDLQDIKALNSGGVKIVGPYVAPTFVSGTTYKATFRIDGTLLDIAGRYRLIAVVYDMSALPAVRVNSFMSNEYTVSAVNEYAGEGIEFKGRLCDVQREFTGDDLECVVEERMKSKLRLNYFYDKWKNDIFNRLGIVVTNDIRHYLTKIEFTIYREYTNYLGVVRNIHDYRVANKISMASYSAPDIDLAFNTDYSEFAAEWRNRYESGTDAIQTLVGGFNFIPIQDKQYWGGKTFTVEWKLTFLYDDHVSPFSDIIVYNQQIRVKDYEEAVQITSDEDNVAWCDTTNVCMKAFMDPVLSPNLYNLINNIELAPGNSSIIEESEEWVPDELAQESTPKIYDQEIAFSETEASYAKWCIDTSKLSLNSQYKISAIAKKYFPRYRLITEDETALIKTEFVEQLVEERN